MWHWLVLHGIGGRTIEEAKRTITYGEALQWFSFVRDHGMPQQNLQNGLAVISSLIANALGGKTEPKDFMRKPVTTSTTNEEDDEATIEDVLAILSGNTK